MRGLWSENMPEVLYVARRVSRRADATFPDDWCRSRVRRTGARGRCAEARDILQGRRAHFPGEMPGVPSAELDRADVAHHLSGSPALGPLDQGACGGSADAAVAHRPYRRRAEVQERHVAQ